MRFYCNYCGKSVSSELPNDSILRAIAICPECIDRAKTHFDFLDYHLAKIIKEVRNDPNSNG